MKITPPVRFQKGYRKFFFLFLLLALVGSSLSLLSPLLINHWQQAGLALTRDRLILLIAILLGALLLDFVLCLIRERFAKVFNESNFTDLLEQFFHLEYDFISESGSAKLIMYMQDVVNAAYSYMTGTVINFFTAILNAAVILIVTWRIRPWVSLILLSLLPLNYFSYKLLNKILAQRSMNLSKVCSSSYQTILSYLSEVDFIKQLPAADPIIEKLRPTIDKNYQVMADINVVAQGASQLIRRLTQLLQTILIVCLIFLSGNNPETLSDVAILILLIPFYTNAVSVITDARLEHTRLSVAQHFVDEWSDHYEKDGTETLSEVREIRFDIKDLSVGDKVLQSSIQGTYHPGDVVWVRGDSGVGKSTLIKLLPRFRTSDTLFINGQDIRSFRLESLRKQVAYMGQKPPIVHGTLRDNLFLGEIHDPQKEALYLQEPLMKSILATKSMDSIIDVGGTNLSGGEKQKLTLTRLLQKKTPILVLDEVTVGIDQDTVEEIWNRISQIKDNRILFVISHEPLPEGLATHVLQLS